MKEIIKLILTDGWAAFVTIFIIAIGGTVVNTGLNRYWRHKTIRKQGYPPPHCDADGDFPAKEKEDEE